MLGRSFQCHVVLPLRKSRGQVPLVEPEHPAAVRWIAGHDPLSRFLGRGRTAIFAPQGKPLSDGR